MESSSRIWEICPDKRDIKSLEPNKGTSSKCLVRFHNCSDDAVALYWIDFNGLPRKYPNLRPRESITIDTFVSHLWFFETVEPTSPTSSQRERILAIPEESIGPTCNASNYCYEPIDSNEQFSTKDPVKDGHVCPLCKYVINKYSRRPISSPCHHYTGEARLSSSDLSTSGASYFYSAGNYIYSCSDITHKGEHSTKRRNIFLVKSFYNLKERCYLQISSRKPKLSSLDLPSCILKDYMQFVVAKTGVEYHLQR